MRISIRNDLATLNLDPHRECGYGSRFIGDGIDNVVGNYFNFQSAAVNSYGSTLLFHHIDKFCVYFYRQKL